MLLGCSEGLKIQDNEIAPWFNVNKSTLEDIVFVFERNTCLVRVELGSMEFIKQACENEAGKKDIENVQAMLRSMDLVLATAYRDKEGNFNVSILLYRDRPDPKNKSSAVSVEYWNSLPKRWEESLGCELFKPLAVKNWYVSHYPGIVGCN